MSLPYWLLCPTGVLLLALVSCTHAPVSPPIAESPKASPISTPAQPVSAKSVPAQPDAVALNNRAVGKIQAKDIKGAISDFSTAITLQPNMAEAYLGRGIAHSVDENHQSAIADYTKALSLKPNMAEAYLNRADDRFALGDKAKAIADLKQAKTLFTKAGDTKNAKEAEARLASLQLPKVQVDQPTQQNEPDRPAPEPTEQATTPSAPAGYVAGTCRELAAMGLSRFRPGDPNYTARRDGDSDGIACE
jgi:tetratricopeptide (TPR) repeat protein